YISVKAKNGAGLWSEISSSDGIIADLSIPTSPKPMISAKYTNSTAVSWYWSEVKDEPSGLEGYYIAIGTYEGGEDVGVDVWVKTAHYTYPFGVDGITYYLKVKAKDLAGNIGDYGPSSDGIKVDISLPSIYSISQLQAFISKKTINWSWSAYDKVSGIKGYYICIGTFYSGDDILKVWVNESSYEFIGIEGKTYYFKVRAEDLAGNIGEYELSNGVTIDTTQPSAGSVSDTGEYTNLNVLIVEWSGFSDDISGIVDYEYAVGTTKFGTEITSFTPCGIEKKLIIKLGFEEGKKYYVTVRARNGAGLLSEPACSDGIIIDTLPPDTPIPYCPSGNYTNKSSITWVWEDVNASYYVYIGSSYGKEDIISAITQKPTYTFLYGSNGIKYFIKIRAFDFAGNLGNFSFGDAVTIDTERPKSPKPTSPNYSHTAILTWTWSGGKDEVSGIIGYYIAIGTYEGGEDILAPTFTKNTNYTYFSGLERVKYYAKVSAMDFAGNLGEYEIGDFVSVHTIKPTGSIIINNGADFVNSLTVTITISSDYGREFIISNEPSFSLGTWESYTRTKT
ncbi:MAG: hypothetical protein AB1779_12265, partial [Candidatus Thermoplasmatota archaeon]